MNSVIELNPNRYTVVCEKRLVAKYAGHVDMGKCNQVSKQLFKELCKAFTQNGEYQSDDVMIALAMMVTRFGIEMTVQNPKNEWASDGFPEFCSLIGPGGGFGVKQ